MSDLRSLLERESRRFIQQDGAFERLLHRRNRKRRNQRIAAGAVGLAVGLAAILIGSSLIRSDQSVPVQPAPTPMENGPITFFGLTSGLRSLKLDGQNTSLVDCADRCTETSSADWSPDGGRVAFSASCGGGCSSAGDLYHGIRVLDLATGGDRLLIGGEFFAPSLDWSPDGTRISYVADGRIHIMDVDGSNATQLPTTDVETASWSPDGTHFVYASGGVLIVMNADGSDATTVVPSSRPAFSPQWSPDALILTPCKLPFFNRF